MSKVYIAAWRVRDVLRGPMTAVIGSTDSRTGGHFLTERQLLLALPVSNG